jgi:thiamine-phosphate pyrophosphorylase
MTNSDTFSEIFMREARPPCQLYVISPPVLPPNFADILEKAVSAGPVAAFQLRIKSISDHEIARLSGPLIELCRQHEVAFILNDNPSLAKRIGADGVHIGQGDGDVRDARAMLGADVQIGVTCHDSRHLAMEAGENGADYVAFGAFFPTRTKATEHVATLDLLGWWTTVSPIPCVAIGGITPENAAPLVKAGADFLAVSAAVWDHPDGPDVAVRQFNALF